MKVLNLYGGPGSGKSTTAAYIFYRLKCAGFKAELAREVAKDWIFDGRGVQLERNQLKVSTEQYSRLKDLEASGCEIAVSDSPLPMGLIYAYENKVPYFVQLSGIIYKAHSEFENYNIFVRRVKPYEQFGRTQDEAAARELDDKIFRLLTSQDEPYLTVEGSRAAVEPFVDKLLAGLETAEIDKRLTNVL